MTEPRTTSTKNAEVSVEQADQAPRLVSVEMPYLPMA